MAKAKDDATPAAKIDPNAQYRVKVTKLVQAGPRAVLHPRHDNVVKGSMLATIVDQVKSYEPA